MAQKMSYFSKLGLYSKKLMTFEYCILGVTFRLAPWKFALHDLEGPNLRSLKIPIVSKWQRKCQIAKKWVFVGKNWLHFTIVYWGWPIIWHLEILHCMTSKGQTEGHQNFPYKVNGRSLGTPCEQNAAYSFYVRDLNPSILWQGWLPHEPLKNWIS